MESNYENNRWIATNFQEWWRHLNINLAQRGEAEALYGEAMPWYSGLIVKHLPERLVNQIINSRRAP